MEAVVEDQVLAVMVVRAAAVHSLAEAAEAVALV
jgi:hypothetical protein